MNAADYHIYVDLDGVLVDLLGEIERVTGHRIINQEEDRSNPQDNQAWINFHEELKKGTELFYNAEEMPDAQELWNYIKKYNPNVLTATGKRNVTEVDDQKRRWVNEHLSGYKKIYTVTASRNKAKFAWPDSILIDDRKKSIGPWVERGGIGVLHTSAENTIAELKKLGL